MYMSPVKWIFLNLDWQVVTLGTCLLYELPPIIGILIHGHLIVLLIVR